MNDGGAAYHLPLAYGELNASDSDELKALKEQIFRYIGFDCASYKEPCLRRRIAVRLRARGLHRYGDYARLLDSDTGERHRLLDAITINVSKFFRNPTMWRALEMHVVPALFNASADRVRIESVGCAAGEEPYSLAMLLREHALRTGREAELARFDLVGSDIDPNILQTARLGRYGSFSFTDMDVALRRDWFLPPDHTELRPEVREMVRFETRDALRHELPGGQQLIMCRNVIIYFERSIQEQLFLKFHNALAPGGVLVMGKVETLLGRALSLFKPIVPRERIFVKA